MINLLLGIIGAGSLYTLFLRLKDWIAGMHVMSEKAKEQTVSTQIAQDAQTVATDAQKAKEDYDAYEKLKSSTSNNTDGSNSAS